VNYFTGELMNRLKKPNVGRMIRLLRDQERLSLRELSEKSGLSVTAISKIERGETSPTVASLHQLANALEVHVTDFFRQDINLASIFVKEDEVTLLRSKGIVIEGLGSGLPHQQLEPFKLTIAPNSGNSFDPVSHSGEEFVYCLSGRLEYQVGDESYTLEAGDRLLFKANQPHNWKNPGPEPAEIILVLETDAGQPLPHKIH